MADVLEVLLTLLRAGGAEPIGVAAPSTGISDAAILRFSERHRIVPLLHDRCSASGGPGVSPAIRSAWADRARAGVTGNLHLVSELLKLIDAFAGAGIAIIPFKGPLLAWELYGSFAAREPGDLDILVARAEIVRAKRLLVSMGFRPFFPTSIPREATYLASLSGAREERYLRGHNEHHFIRGDGELNIDLHWNVVPAFMAVSLAPALLWQNLRKVSLAGTQVSTFGLEELLLVLCLNGAKDGWGRLDRICDVAQLIIAHQSIDFVRCLHMADSIGCRRILFIGLYFAHFFLATPLPMELKNAIACDRAIPSLAVRIRWNLLEASERPAEVASPARALLQFRLRERLRDRIHFCLAQLSPTVGDQAAFPLPQPLSFLHYLLRPLRLGARYLLPQRPLSRDGM